MARPRKRPIAVEISPATPVFVETAPVQHVACNAVTVEGSVFYAQAVDINIDGGVITAVSATGEKIRLFFTREVAAGLKYLHR